MAGKGFEGTPFKVGRDLPDYFVGHTHSCVLSSPCFLVEILCENTSQSQKAPVRKSPAAATICLEF